MWVFPRPQGTKKDVTYVGFKFWFVGVGQDRQQFDDGIRIPSISLFLLPKCEAHLYVVGLLPTGRADPARTQVTVLFESF